jgi:hypothetical protein
MAEGQSYSARREAVRAKLALRRPATVSVFSAGRGPDSGRREYRHLGLSARFEATSSSHFRSAEEQR